MTNRRDFNKIEYSGKNVTFDALIRRLETEENIKFRLLAKSKNLGKDWVQNSKVIEEKKLAVQVIDLDRSILNINSIRTLKSHKVLITYNSLSSLNQIQLQSFEQICNNSTRLFLLLDDKKLKKKTPKHILNALVDLKINKYLRFKDKFDINSKQYKVIKRYLFSINFCTVKLPLLVDNIITVRSLTPLFFGMPEINFLQFSINILKYVALFKQCKTLFFKIKFPYKFISSPENLKFLSIIALLNWKKIRFNRVDFAPYPQGNIKVKDSFEARAHCKILLCLLKERSSVAKNENLAMALHAWVISTFRFEEMKYLRYDEISQSLPGFFLS